MTETGVSRCTVAARQLGNKHSSGDTEIMRMSELLKEATKLTQYKLEFNGMGRLPITLHTDSDVARKFRYKKGVGYDCKRRLQELINWLKTDSNKLSKAH